MLELSECLPNKDKKVIQEILQRLLFDESSYNNIIPVVGSRIQGSFKHKVSAIYDDITSDSVWKQRVDRIERVRVGIWKKYGFNLPVEHPASKLGIKLIRHEEYLDKIYFWNNNVLDSCEIEQIIPEKLKNDWLKSRYLTQPYEENKTEIRKIAKAANELAETQIREIIQDHLKNINTPKYEASK
ncbi:hypothetical protein GO491_11900 [Flavobacteriaceae bacterium Ap0902]|nr:hypothetical protein [Flavobacteriaceae bacterium Ap0902]